MRTRSTTIFNTFVLRNVQAWLEFPPTGENPAFNVVYVYMVFLICFKTNHA